MDRFLGEYRVPKASAAGGRYYAQAMEVRRQAGKAQEFKVVRRGWCLGNQAFRKELWRKWGSGGERIITGEEVYESEVAKAERIVADELRWRGWGEAELRARAKGDKGKVAMATRNDDDVEVGGGAPGDGQLESRLESAGCGAKESTMKGESVKCENRPLCDPFATPLRPLCDPFLALV